MCKSKRSETRFNLVETISSFFRTPVLLSRGSSVIVFSTDDDLCMATSLYRSKVLKNSVFYFDLSSANMFPSHYNPLDAVRMGKNEYSDAQGIAHILVYQDDCRDHGHKDCCPNHDHWKASAVLLITGAILHVLYARKNRTLTEVVNFLSEMSFNQILDTMLFTEHGPGAKYGWVDSLTGEPTSVNPVIASIARKFKKSDYPELSGIFSTALLCLAIFNDPVVASVTKQSDLEVQHLLSEGVRSTVFFKLSSNRYFASVQLSRLFLNHLLVIGGNHYFESWNQVGSVQPFLILFDGCYSDRFLPEFFRNQAHLLKNKVWVCCCDRNFGLFEKVLSFFNSIKFFGLRCIAKFLFDKEYYAGCIEIPDVWVICNDFDDIDDVVEFKKPATRVEQYSYVPKPIIVSSDTSS